MNLRISGGPHGLLIHGRTKGKVQVAKHTSSGGRINVLEMWPMCVVGALVAGRLTLHCLESRWRGVAVFQCMGLMVMMSIVAEGGG